jgi:hypothetical protein
MHVRCAERPFSQGKKIPRTLSLIKACSDADYTKELYMICRSWHLKCMHGALDCDEIKLRPTVSSTTMARLISTVYPRCISFIFFLLQHPLTSVLGILKMLFFRGFLSQVDTYGLVLERADIATQHLVALLVFHLAHGPSL